MKLAARRSHLLLGIPCALVLLAAGDAPLDVAGFRERMAELAKQEMAEPTLPAAERGASRHEREALVEKGTHLAEKATGLEGELPKQLADLDRLRRDLENGPELPPAAQPGAHEALAFEQAVELARYQVGNKRRRLETLRSELASVEDRLQESRLAVEKAHRREDAASAGSEVEGADGARARTELLLARGQQQVEAFRGAYLERLLYSRRIRLEAAELEVTMQQRVLDARIAALATLRRLLGVGREEADRRIAELRLRRAVLVEERAAHERELEQAMQEQRAAEQRLEKERAKEGPPSEEELTLLRTRLDTVHEKRKTAAGEGERDDLEIDLLDRQARLWDSAAELVAKAGRAREDAAEVFRAELDAERSRVGERRTGLAALQQIARDDLDQIRDGIRYSKTRIGAADEMAEEAAPADRKTLATRRATLETTIASLDEAEEFAQRRLLILVDKERLLSEQVEFLDGVTERTRALFTRGADRVTLQSFRDLAVLGGSVARRVGPFFDAPPRAAELEAIWDRGAGSLRGAVGRLLVLLALGLALSVVVARALRRALLASRPDSLPRAGLILALHALVPAVILVVLLLALLPLRPELPGPGIVDRASELTRLALSALDLFAALALGAVVVLAARGLWLAGEQSGLDEATVIRWRFLITWGRLGALSWIALRGLALLARSWDPPPSVPFMLDTAALLALLAAGTLIAVRMREQIAWLLAIRRTEERKAGDGVAAGELYRRLATLCVYLLLVYVMGILGAYVSGYGELASWLLARSAQTLGVALVAVALGRLVLYLAARRMIELDRIESITGRPHALDREAYRAVTAIGLLTLGAATVTVVLSVWGVDPPQAWSRLQGILATGLFAVNETRVTLKSVLTFIFILAVAVAISRAIRRLLATQIFPRAQVDKGVQHALATIINYVILLTALFMGFSAIGFDLTTLKVVAGAVGLGIGFGLQNIAANFVSGLIILFERPIKADDVVEVSGTVGRIETVSARATVVRTRDNVSVIVPNTDFVSGQVVNWSHRDPRTRLRLPLGVAYGSDVDKLKAAMLGVADDHRDVLKAPVPELRFLGFGDSSLDFELLVWTADPWPSERIKSDLYYAIEGALRDAGIVIPFPQRDLHIIDDPGSRGRGSGGPAGTSPAATTSSR